MVDELIFKAVLAGTGATVFMDLAALAQKRLLSLQSLDYAMVGRWLCHAVRGRFIHRPITASRAVAGERLIGWAAHYLTGILFAAAFLAVLGEEWLNNPSLWPALAFGALTLCAPFLILQPGIGAGIAARRTPAPNTARLKSLATHLTFGAGLWVSAHGLSLL
ncbi:DUF2938 domain-containing protein [Leisingera methylohalidivorans]|uniref:Membrane protein n=1 Tax=Leisingera methylohalidivorans DSM 14336 TaxID=999552 RepID=V9VTC4_9RHOB|nr:DUF2938 domain-containing protein [Leisingera methylohalidivorans]AHD00127.1 membrane protein [Leisingera methylohalidivorans DSM 14336]